MAKEKKRKPAAQPTRTPSDLSWTDNQWFPWGVAGLYLVIVIILFRDFVFSNLMLYGSDTLQAAGTYFRYLHITDWPNYGWTPYAFGGMPVVDAFHSDLYYPFTMVVKLWFGLDGIERTRGWELIPHIWLGGMAMYWAARGWNLSRMASAIAGLAYMTSGYFISMVHPGHDGKLYVTAWFPLGFLFLKRIWDDARPRDMAIFAVIVGFIILTPHVQMAYFALWGYAGYSVYRIVRTLREEKRFPWLPSAGALGGVLLAVGISAIQFYPAYFYVKEHSPRSGEGRGFDYASSWSLHPEEIVSEVVPEFSGVSDKDSNSYWGRNWFKDNSEYGGLVALLLAVFVVFRTRFRDRWFFFGLGVFAALYGLGAHTPLFKLFYYLVPNVKQMRAPSMIMFLYVFAIVLCAAAAIDALWKYKQERGTSGSPTKLLWIISAVLGGVALLLSIAPSGMMSAYTSMFYGNIEPQKSAVLAAHEGSIIAGFWLAALISAGVAYFSTSAANKKALWALGGIAVLVLIDNVRMDTRFIKVVDLDRYMPHDPVVDFLHKQPGPFRVVAAPRGFPSNYFAFNGIPEQTGYHGNQLRSYNTFLGGPTQQYAFARPALSMGAIKYIIFRRGANLEGDLTDPTLRKVYDQNNVVVYENLIVAPHARLTTCWELHDPADTAYTRLYDTSFDYHNCVVVDSALPFESHLDSISPGTAEVTDYEHEKVVVSVEAAADALLVLADNNYPAWHAYVDDQPAPIVTTNATFRGVIVPAGNHIVRFEYHSSRQALGTWVTFCSLLLAGAVIAVDTWRPRRRDT